ncbi:NUDIX hydrolase [Parafrankia sp. Ea1.12]|uniref:NUDIX hydrolase n=1 Tax=Parafrankia sp. Ea1.12 TaxID=573499 RepID=UPI000DA478EB|nr:NUDIX hydrolase [Parafrankia sp. Ea1.12]SQD93900.1 NUDIX hydrolase [Parafrankia sp. Ea1.12]
MSITNEAVGRVLAAYLTAHPGDRERLGPLVRASAAPARGSARLTSRRTLPGHVTCSTVAVNDEGRILQIHHRASGLWLQPGGHIEDRDGSLFGAALRELAEETGIGRRRVSAISEQPVDVDIHWVSASAARGEPEHLHYDFRFLVEIRGSGLAPVETGLDPDDPETTRPLSAPPLAVPPPAVPPPAVPVATDGPAGRTASSPGVGASGPVPPGVAGTKVPGPSAAPPGAHGAAGAACTPMPGTAQGTAAGVPVGVILQVEEVAGARWAEVSALGGRLARRVAAALVDPGARCR